MYGSRHALGLSTVRRIEVDSSSLWQCLLLEVMLLFLQRMHELLRILVHEEYNKGGRQTKGAKESQTTLHSFTTAGGDTSQSKWPPAESHFQCHVSNDSERPPPANSGERGIQRFRDLVGIKVYHGLTPAYSAVSLAIMDVKSPRFVNRSYFLQRDNGHLEDAVISLNHLSHADGWKSALSFFPVHTFMAATLLKIASEYEELVFAYALHMHTNFLVFEHFTELDYKCPVGSKTQWYIHRWGHAYIGSCTANMHFCQACLALCQAILFCGVSISEGPLWGEVNIHPNVVATLAYASMWHCTFFLLHCRYLKLGCSILMMCWRIISMQKGTYIMQSSHLVNSKSRPGSQRKCHSSKSLTPCQESEVPSRPSSNSRDKSVAIEHSALQ